MSNQQNDQIYELIGEEMEEFSDNELFEKLPKTLQVAVHYNCGNDKDKFSDKVCEMYQEWRFENWAYVD